MSFANSKNSSIISNRKPFATSPDDIKFPWKITAFCSESSSGGCSQYSCTVAPGTVNNMVATDHIASEGKLKEFTLSSDALQYVICTCTTNTKVVTSLSLSVESSLPDIPDPGLYVGQSTYPILIGIVYNSVVYQIANTLLTLSLVTAYVDPANATTGVSEGVYMTWSLSSSGGLQSSEGVSGGGY